VYWEPTITWQGYKRPDYHGSGQANMVALGPNGLLSQGQVVPAGSQVQFMADFSGPVYGDPADLCSAEWSVPNGGFEPYCDYWATLRWEVTVTGPLRLDVTITGYEKREVSFDANGGEGVVGSVGNSKPDPDYVVSLPSGGFVRDGFVLSGWNSGADGQGTGYELGGDYTLAGVSDVLFAQWVGTGSELLEVFGGPVVVDGGDGSEAAPFVVEVETGRPVLGTQDLVVSPDGVASVSLDAGFGAGVQVDLAAGAGTDVFVKVTSGAGVSKFYKLVVWRLAETGTLAGLLDTLAGLKADGVFDVYTSTSVKKLDQAVDAAKQVLGKDHVSQGEVDQARQAILDAVDNLVVKGVVDPSDVTELEQLVQVAENVDRALFTAGSLAVLDDKLAAGVAVLGDQGRTGDDIAAARDGLLAGLAGLRLHYTVEVRTQVSDVVVKRKKSFQIGGVGYLTSGVLQDLDYTSSDPAVATVSSTGKVTGVGVGTAVVTASSRTPGFDGSPVTAAVQVQVVKSPPSVKSVKADVPKALAPGQVVWIATTWSKPSAAPGKVTFSSSNKKIATVDKAGRLVAVGSGKVKIKVTAGSRHKTYTVYVAMIEDHKPRIDGHRKVGTTLQAVSAAWAPQDVALQYQWLRNGKPIEGATSDTYTIEDADWHTRLQVRITGSKDGYPTVTRTSNKTMKIYR
jgi:hypothetical protein